MPWFPPALVRCGVCTLALFALWARPVVAQTDERASGQVVEGERLVDNDYAFALERPDESWSLLHEDEVRTMVPDAVAGMMRAPLTWSCVIVERVPDLDLDAYADYLIGTMELQDVRVVERVAAELDGRPAVSYQVVGQHEGLELTFRTVISGREGFAYQVVTWAPLQPPPSISDLNRPARSFRFLETVPRARFAGAIVANLHGPGWRVRDGVFESAAYGLRVVPAEGWRLVVGVELEVLNSDAELALYHQGSETFLTVIPEQAAGVDRKELIASVRRSTAEAMGALPTGRLIQWRVGERVRRFVELTTRGDGPFDQILAHGAWFQGEQCTQVLLNYQPALADQAEAAIAEALKGFSELGPEERAELTAQLAELPDPEEHVGLDLCLRGGVFRDFDCGLEWRKPDQGYWSVQADQSVRVDNPDVRLQFESISTGVLGTIEARRGVEVDPRDWHDDAVNWIFDLPAGRVIDATAPTELAGAPALTTRVGATWDGIPLQWRITTCITGGRGVIHTVWATYAGLERYPDAVQASLDALTVHADGLVEIERTPGRFVDRRFGFEVDFGAVASRPRDRTPAGRESICRVVSSRRGPDSLFAVCSWVPQAAETPDQVEALFIDLVGSFMASELSRPVHRLDWEAEAIEIDGRPAKRLIFGTHDPWIEAQFMLVGERIVGALCISPDEFSPMLPPDLLKPVD